MEKVDRLRLERKETQLRCELYKVGADIRSLKKDQSVLKEQQSQNLKRYDMVRQRILSQESSGCKRALAPAMKEGHLRQDLKQLKALRQESAKLDKALHKLGELQSQLSEKLLKSDKRAGRLKIMLSDSSTQASQALESQQLEELNEVASAKKLRRFSALGHEASLVREEENAALNILQGMVRKEASEVSFNDRLLNFSSPGSVACAQERTAADINLSSQQPQLSRFDPESIVERILYFQRYSSELGAALKLQFRTLNGEMLTMEIQALDDRCVGLRIFARNRKESALFKAQERELRRALEDVDLGLTEYEVSS